MIRIQSESLRLFTVIKTNIDHRVRLQLRSISLNKIGLRRKPHCLENKTKILAFFLSQIVFNKVIFYRIKSKG